MTSPTKTESDGAAASASELRAGVPEVSRVEASVRFFGTDDAAHDGPGWYWWESEYPEEGCSGAFFTRKLAIEHALSCYPHYDFKEQRP